MADNSAIEWTDATLNPVTGCTKITAGCDNCWRTIRSRARAHCWGTAIWRSRSIRARTPSAIRGSCPSRGDSLGEMALHYFATSEQLRCELRLACARTEAGWRAGALVLERVADEGGVDPDLDDESLEEAWRTASILASTLKASELLDDALAPEQLLYRLFNLFDMFLL